MRTVDAGLSKEPVIVDKGVPIELDDPAFTQALAFHHIQSR